METNDKVELRICNKTAEIHTCRLGAIHLNEREEKILQDYLTTHEREVREEALEIVEDAVTWYNTNNQIPNSELQKGEEHWEMIRKVVRDSLNEISDRIKTKLLPEDKQ